MNDYMKRVMLYKSSLQTAREWLKNGIITKAEFKKCSTILAERYGISLCSIYVE